MEGKTNDDYLYQIIIYIINIYKYNIYYKAITTSLKYIEKSMRTEIQKNFPRVIKIKSQISEEKDGLCHN